MWPKLYRHQISVFIYHITRKRAHVITKEFIFLHLLLLENTVFMYVKLVKTKFTFWINVIKLFDRNSFKFALIHVLLFCMTQQNEYLMCIVTLKHDTCFRWEAKVVIRLTNIVAFLCRYLGHYWNYCFY